jgi:hypothetical protein
VFLLGVSKFGSVRFLPEKNSQTEKKKRDPKPNRNRPKPAGSGPVSVRFFIQKTGQTYRLILGFLMGFVMGF